MGGINFLITLCFTGKTNAQIQATIMIYNKPLLNFLLTQLYTKLSIEARTFIINTFTVTIPEY